MCQSIAACRRRGFEDPPRHHQVEATAVLEQTRPLLTVRNFHHHRKMEKKSSVEHQSRLKIVTFRSISVQPRPPPTIDRGPTHSSQFPLTNPAKWLERLTVAREDETSQGRSSKKAEKVSYFEVIFELPEKPTVMKSLSFDSLHLIELLLSRPRCF